MGRYFAIGILRQYHSPNMNAAQAKELAIKCLQILYLRDCGAGNNIQIGVFTDCGIEISEPIFIETQWYLSFYHLGRTMIFTNPQFRCLWLAVNFRPLLCWLSTSINRLHT